MERVLVIDDDWRMRDMLAKVLAFAGFDAVDAPNGRVGIRVHRNDPCALVITDILMPERDGLETIRMLRFESPATPIIAISGAPGHFVAARELGAHAVLRKPFCAKELVRLVKKLLHVAPEGAPDAARPGLASGRADPTDRFGLSDDTIAAEVARHRLLGAASIDCYVPTRNEVEMLPAPVLGRILEQWMWESPATLAPTAVQTADVLAILVARPDAAELRATVAMCRSYLSSAHTRSEARVDRAPR